jgi:hypothetical protein
MSKINQSENEFDADEEKRKGAQSLPAIEKWIHFSSLYSYRNIATIQKTECLIFSVFGFSFRSQLKAKVKCTGFFFLPVQNFKGFFSFGKSLR